MFLSLGLADDIIDAIVDELGYSAPHALSHLDKKGVEQLMNAIRKPGKMKGGTWNTGINVPLWLQSLLWAHALLPSTRGAVGRSFIPASINLRFLRSFDSSKRSKTTTTTRWLMIHGLFGTQRIALQVPI